MMFQAVLSHLASGQLFPSYNNTDTVLYEPAPSEEWVCGNTYPIRWSSNTSDFPERFNVDARLMAGPAVTATSKEGFNVVSDYYSSRVFSVFVNCGDIPEDEFVAGNDYYLVFSDSGGSDWSMISGGRVRIKATVGDLEVPISADDPSIWDEYEPYGVTNYSYPLNIENVSWVLSTLGQYHIGNDNNYIDNSFGSGRWYIKNSRMQGTVSSAVLVSDHVNLIANVYRPTYGSGIDNSEDDWSINLMVDQIECETLGVYCGGSGARAHRGFLIEYLLTRNDDLQAIMDSVIYNDFGCRTAEYDTRVLFTGFSQGGGLAQLAAVDMANELEKAGLLERNPVLLMTFGSPPTGDEKFVAAAKRLIPETHRERFVHRFNKIDGVDQYLPFRIPNHKLNPAIDFTNLDLCTETSVPLDAVDYNGWSAEDTTDTVIWHSGDFIPSLRVYCPDLIKSGVEVVLQVKLDERNSRITNLEFPHIDDDAYDMWPGVSEGYVPSAVGGKGPFNVYSNFGPSDSKYCGVEPIDGEYGTTGPMFDCHDLVAYASGIHNQALSVDDNIRSFLPYSCGDGTTGTGGGNSSSTFTGGVLTAVAIAFFIL